MKLLSRFRRHWAIGAILAVTALLAACSSGTITIAGTSTPPAGTATSGPAPTTTAVPTNTAATGPSTTCAALIASKNPTMPSNMMFPAGTILSTPSVTAMGEASFVVQATVGCASPSDTNLTITSGHGSVPFTNGLYFSGWVHSGKFPFDGQLEQDCGAIPCFVFNADPTKPEYLALDQVTDHGGGVISFHLRTALSPTPPTCDKHFSTAYYYTLNPYASATDIYGNIHLPPLSRIQPDDAAGHLGFDVCSPGSSSAVTTFVSNQLRAQGWSPTDAAGDWANGTHTLLASLENYDSAHDTTVMIISYPNPAITG